jgi:hypothetical protein
VCLFGYLGHFCFLAHMAFYFLPLYLRPMGWAHKADWTITFLVTYVFTMPISSDKASGDLLHLAFVFCLHFLRMFCLSLRCVCCCACMVHIKFTARPRTPIVLLKLSRWPRTKLWRPPCSRGRPQRKLPHRAVLSLPARVSLVILETMRLPLTILSA